MRSLIAALFLTLAITVSLHAAPTFHFETKDWRGEQIQLPPGFAPTLGWKGIEDIRFAPGMFQADAEDFFSYALVFLLEEGADVSPEGIQREVLTYYQGLSTAVLKGKGVTVDTSKFELSLAEPKTTDDATTISAVLDWIEPFATQKQQKLNLEILVRKHGAQPALFFIVSPQPDDHEIWKELKGIRDAFRIED